MEFTVAVYERRQGHHHHWWTLGLGSCNQNRSGRHAGKLRHKLLDDLRKALGKAQPAALESYQLPRGIELRRVRLELRLGRGRRYSGHFPLVLAPRQTTATSSLVVAYHPLRQNAWFPFDSEAPLEEQAARFFGQEWSELDDEDLEPLECVKRERLRLLSLNATPKTLLDELQDRREEKGLLLGGERPRRRGQLSILPEIAVDETRSRSTGAALGRPRATYRERLARQAGGGSSLAVVGAPGVGKTTLIRQWIADLLHDDGYATHANLDRCRHVWRLAGRRLIAGMSYVGQWEERVLGLIEEAREHRVVLWIEDLHAFGQLGRTLGSDRNLADVLRSAVARREIQVIAELTPSRLQILDEDAPAFAALFARLTVEPPSVEETLGLLIHETRGLELEHDVVIAPAIYRTLLEVCQSLLVTTALPGKALDLLRGLARRLENSAGKPPIGPSQVLDLVAERTGIPRLLLEPTQTLTAATIEQRLEQSVVGQAVAVAAARDVVLRIKAGLVDPHRPYGVLLFTGPTGTGKTELAKALAAYLYGDATRLVRFDMSEYAGPDAAARLIGERGRPRGQLTTAVREQPFAVVLFDEIEKCHPSVLHLLLQITGDGRLSDAAGDIADFTHAVVVLTSNLGASGRSRLGFDRAAAESVVQDILAAVKAHFPPELFNRIDRVVPFRPLDPEVARTIARRELARLLARRGLVERGIFVTTTERVLDRVCSDGFNAEEGARSLKRYLDRHIGGPLSELIAGSVGAEMRRIALYATETGVALYSEEMREATPIENTSPLEPFLRRSTDEIRGELPAARELVEALADSPELGSLSDKLRAHLSEYQIGRTGVADRIYNFDALRGRLSDLAERLTRQIEVAVPDLAEQIELDSFSFLTRNDGWNDNLPVRVRVLDRRAFGDASMLANRAELLAILAEVHFLRLALTRVEDRERHAVFVDLSHIGQAATQERFAKRREGLLEWLGGFYGSARGELESFAATLEDGTRKSGDEPRALTAALRRHPRRLVLKIAGLSVLDLFAGEHGGHVRTSLGGATEIVRVDVRPAPPGKTAVEALDERLATRERFIDALESGGDAPENPEELLPIVRRYRYDPPPSGKAAPCEVEDYVLCHAAEHRVRHFSDVLTVLGLLHQTVETA